jgi:hypothetical protein
MKKIMAVAWWPVLALGNSWLWVVWPVPVLPENLEVLIVVGPWIPALIRSFYAMTLSGEGV